jgi:hypothetical protein
MRAMLLLIGSLALVLGACSSNKGGSHAPPVPDKTLLNGKWKSVSEAQLLAGYEFDADGTLKLKILGMKDPVPGRYTWSGERTVEVEYSTAEDVHKAYEATAKAFKEDIQERMKTKELDGKIGIGMISAVKDKLPAKESFVVGLTDPRFLVLTRQDGGTLSFDKVE